MANEEHLAILMQGVEVWNAWRIGHPQVRPDLGGASLVDANLGGANLGGANLDYARLAHASLDRASLVRASLDRASLAGASLVGAHLDHARLASTILANADFNTASLVGAHLAGADLTMASLVDTYLAGVNLRGVILFETIFGDVDLSGCKGLATCKHHGPSTIDHRTLQRSGPLPLIFLRGIGLPDNLIDYLPSLLNQPIQLYSCFISYSSADEAFARRLHADLQDRHVRCWFAPEDMKTGDRIGETVDAAIRLRDKLLLILSETSLTSAWVLKEVRTALAEEKQHGRTVLFPVRVDDAVMDTTEQWAHDIKRTRHIGDFRRWKRHDAYTKALDRLLRDLRVEKP